MWMLYARAPTPNASYWPGRRLLALIDALAWPAVVAVMVTRSQVELAIVGNVVLALCGLFAIRRFCRAAWRNEQYRFTTWRLGVPLAALLALGTLLKVATQFP